VALDARDRRVTAIHEAGHTIACRALLPGDVVQHVTIVPGTKGSGGHMLRIPAERMQTKAVLRASVQIALAGRAAEEAYFGKDEISVGASNDLEVATHTVEQMICRLGMDEEAGLMTRRERDAAEIVGKRMKEYYDATRELIQERREQLVRLADALEERETLTGDEVDQVISA
jgi:cell division protease FtsH